MATLRIVAVGPYLDQADTDKAVKAVADAIAALPGWSIARAFPEGDFTGPALAAASAQRQADAEAKALADRSAVDKIAAALAAAVTLSDEQKAAVNAVLEPAVGVAVWKPASSEQPAIEPPAEEIQIP